MLIAKIDVVHASVHRREFGNGLNKQVL